MARWTSKWRIEKGKKGTVSKKGSIKQDEKKQNEKGFYVLENEILQTRLLVDLHLLALSVCANDRLDIRVSDRMCLSPFCPSSFLLRLIYCLSFPNSISSLFFCSLCLSLLSLSLFSLPQTGLSPFSPHSQINFPFVSRAAFIPPPNCFLAPPAPFFFDEEGDE